MSFVEKLDEQALEFFNNVANKPFSEQGVAFLNAYWTEVQSQAEFIFTVAYERIKYADMHAKGIQLVHQYTEGVDMDFDIGLYFFEQLCKYVDEHPEWATEEYKISQPEMMTALKRKQELREKVDVNFDGRVSFLEYLLYQYQDVANPADFVQRSLAHADTPEHPEITKARQLLEEVNKRIQAYEAEKSRLEALASGSGVKALGAKNMLAQLDSSPLAEELNKALITAEAAVRIATKKYGGGAVPAEAGRKSVAENFSNGSVWWLNRDLEEKQKRYGKKSKN